MLDARTLRRREPLVSRRRKRPERNTAKTKPRRETRRATKKMAPRKFDRSANALVHVLLAALQRVIFRS